MKPILFNTEMVNAIVEGRKSATRRVVKPQPTGKVNHYTGYQVDEWRDDRDAGDGQIKGFVMRPPYQPGDTLYVREAWAHLSDWIDTDPELGIMDRYIYKADWFGVEHPRWHPSIHMPKDAARIFLRVTEARAERLQDMEEYDAEQEGYMGCDEERSYYLPEGGMELCANLPGCPYSYWYCRHTVPEGFGKDVWDKTIKPDDLPLYGWDANPWVWVIAFERCEKKEATK